VFGKSDDKAGLDLDSLKVTDSGELSEIQRVADRLDSDEIVHIVAKQSRTKPGGSLIGSPNTIFVTDRRLIIRNPTMLGARENVEDFSYDKITGIKLEKGMLSSTLVLTVPGMGGVSRLGKATGLLAWGRESDGSIDAIPKDKAELILKFVRYKMEIIRKQSSQPTTAPASDDPMTMLKKRFVLGEISKEEFEEMKKMLE
jgi:hypothetical protein